MAVRTKMDETDDRVRSGLEAFLGEYRKKYGKDDNHVPDFLIKDKLTICDWIDIAFFDETIVKERLKE